MPGSLLGFAEKYSKIQYTHFNEYISFTQYFIDDK